MRYPREFMVGIEILMIILGITVLFVPTLTRYIRIPGNRRIKALSSIISGIIINLMDIFIGEGIICRNRRFRHLIQ